ncbi:MAG: C40 family peptidase [Saprospiraceae bacterium]|nr:C40 family peptidase [Saprospiraceae bacterium]
MKQWIICWGVAMMFTSVPIRAQNSINTIIDAVKKEYAPDKRVAIWEVEATRTGKKITLTGKTNVPTAISAIHKKLSAQNIDFKDDITSLPDINLEGKTYGVVNVSVCNLRGEPKHRAELENQAIMGTPIRYYEVKDGWYRAQTPEDYISWLDYGAATHWTKAEYDAWMSAPKVVFIPDFGFAYAKADSEALKISDLVQGCILKKIKQEEIYTIIEFPDGRMGFVETKNVMDYNLWLQTRKPIAETILSTALQFVGRPYLWGGTSSKGIDCSGLTKCVFFWSGILLPRDASQQVQIGEDVLTNKTTWENLRAGDLLFFGKPATTEQPEKITHVAIYLNHGEIIHASGNGSVKVESLDPSRPLFNKACYDSFVRAKRMLDVAGTKGVKLLTQSEFYNSQN